MDLQLQDPGFWASLHGQVPGLLDWDMGNECFLSFTTSHLPLYTQNREWGRGGGARGGGRRRVGEPPVASQARLLAGLAPRRRGSGGPSCDWVPRARGSRPTPPPGTFLGLCGALVLAHQNQAVFFGVGQSQFVLREVSLALFAWCGCCFCFDALACQVLTVGAPPGALGVGHHPGLSAHLDLCAL